MNELESGSSLAEDTWLVPSIPHSHSHSTPHKPSPSLSHLRTHLASSTVTLPSFPSALLPSVPLLYCDHAATHRPLSSIESYLRSVSLPLHANTHTNISITASQSAAFVAEARQIVAESTNAAITGRASKDCVLFAGNGTTGAVATLIDVLNLKSQETSPVVFVGPHEHHSNLIPWRESGCIVVSIHDKNGAVDMDDLEGNLKLERYQNRLRMGVFTAASNVTGLIADVDRIAILLHTYNALAFFDYASAAPYCKMDMNPRTVSGDASKDAIYFSPHKCLGGTGTPGVLVVKKELVSRTNPPGVSGGGTVFYVTNRDHRFLSNRIERYEGGTPDGIGVQRVGLAMLVGRRVAKEYECIVESMEETTIDDAPSNPTTIHPPKTLLEYDCSTHDRVVAEWKQHAPNLILLGCDDQPRSNEANPSCIGRHLPVFSFLIRCGRRFLHYNFVCAILNDVFGIQSRGGCQCAGPYSQRLLGLTRRTLTVGRDGERVSVEVPNESNRNIERALLRSDRPCELLRPGYTRLSLPFKGLREEEVEYVVRAVIWVAKHGWVLLPQYICDHRTGEWRHWSRRGKPLGKTERRWLSHFDVLSPTQISDLNDSSDSIDEESNRARLARAMKNADTLLETAKCDSRYISEVEKMNSADSMLGTANDTGVGGIDDTLEDLRWYVYQRECVHALRDGLDEVPYTMDQDALMGALLRKNSEVNPNGETEFHTEKMICELKHNSSTARSPGLLSFQDGDHGGQASIEDITSGFEEGELSSECRIFNTTIDDWVTIEDFIKQYREDLTSKGVGGKKRDLSEMKRLSGVNGTTCESLSCDGIHSMKIDPDSNESPAQEFLRKNQPNRYITPLAFEKREMKKPSRDDTRWGQVSASHIKIEPISENANDSTNEWNPTEDEKKSDSPDVPMPSALTIDGRSKKNKKNDKLKPPPKLMRFITQAMIQWDMIQEGDRLLLGLSGGKDSLSLLHCLLEFQKKLPIKFEIEVCTIDPMTPSFDPSPLIPYVEGLGLKYHYIRDEIVSRANTSGKDGKMVSSLCAFCARMKRGNLYTCARKNNCNKLVLAQHLDDCAESFLMSVMHNGFIRTMKANYRINSGDVSVIRPLIYCRESLMTEFAKSANLPVINENCPACFEEPKERSRIKKLLSREETLYPNLYDHIRRALIPIMHDDSTAILRSYLEETIAKSVKIANKGKKNAAGATLTGETDTMECHTILNDASLSLQLATEEQLIAELARRRAAKHKLAGAMKRLPTTSGGPDADDDPTGQVCSLNGGDGSIPCRELME